MGYALRQILTNYSLHCETFLIIDVPTDSSYRKVWSGQSTTTNTLLQNTSTKRIKSIVKYNRNLSTKTENTLCMDFVRNIILVIVLKDSALFLSNKFHPIQHLNMITTTRFTLFLIMKQCIFHRKYISAMLR